MEFSAEKIAEFLNGTVEGNPDATVNNISKIEEGKPGTLSFLANPKYTSYIYSTEASIVLVNKDFKSDKKIKTTLVRVDDSYEAFASLLELYSQAKGQKFGIEDNSYIDTKATVGEDVYIAAFAYISAGAKIGNNVKIYPNVFIGDRAVIKDNTTIFAGAKIYDETIIGENCIIHAGVVIGGDGFGFAPTSDGNYKKIPQIGNVVIEDNVEIGANTTIDRATMGSTILRKGVKLDNLIQIAHNVEIGENTAIAALTGVSGSAKIGKNCMIGGQVGIAGHTKIADNIKVAAQTGIMSNIKEKGISLAGTPHMNIRDFFKSMLIFKKLPKLENQIQLIQKEINKLK